jgi:type VI secretion system protein ImpH
VTRAELEEALRRAPTAFDFFQTLRRVECAHSDKPRLGESVQPGKDEPIRLGQDVSLGFAPAALTAFLPGTEGRPPRLQVSFLGLSGPNGPLPLHMTEYVRDRLRNANDPTLARFFDVFHHRILSLFYRAWANSQPTVSRDRPQQDHFLTYVGALIGMAMPALQKRDLFPDAAKLYFAGRLAAQTRNAEGLQAMVGDHFRMPTQVEEFMGAWVDLPESERWHLGSGPDGMRLGMSTNMGARAWNRQTKFRITLGPLQRKQFQSMLPEGEALPRLTALVRNYVGDALDWDLRLILDERTDQPMRLGRGTRLGWDAWLGRCPDGKGRQDLILNPHTHSGREQRAA